MHFHNVCTNKVKFVLSTGCVVSTTMSRVRSLFIPMVIHHHIEKFIRCWKVFIPGRCFSAVRRCYLQLDNVDNLFKIINTTDRHSGRTLLHRAIHLTQPIDQILLSPIVKGGKSGISRALNLKTTTCQQSVEPSAYPCCSRYRCWRRGSAIPA